ncbi:MAG: hypothetical protein KatS3mg002_1535 [Candidatus Woesearchaeota archaeon]|nr:MAG: hypothetical protein KatS3mg002_1535 [Candidatus Woesearchaeota archaeon]
MKNKIISYIFLMFLLSTFVSAWTIHQVTDTLDNELSVDVVIDEFDVVHRVYERNGNIYYSNSIGDFEEFVSQGTSPSIAVGQNNVPQIVFLNSGNLYYAIKSGNQWVITSFEGYAYLADIAVDNTNKAHIVVEGNYDGDSYHEILYLNNVNGTFVGQIIADGFYDSFGRYGNYYEYPSIAVDSQGKYYIPVLFKNWGGNAIYSDIAVIVLTNSNKVFSGSGYYSWSSNIGLSKNSIAIDDYDNVHLTYIINTELFVQSYTLNTVDVVSFGTGITNSAIDATDKIAVVYENQSNIYYTENTGSGFSTPELIDYGTKPVVALGSSNIAYLSNGEIFEAYVGSSNNNNEIPEFSVIAAGLALIGALGIFFFKRR